MRLVIDLQAAQGSNARRGIGRYALSLASAMVRLRGHHEVVIVLNGLLPEHVDTVRAAFQGLLPADHIKVWLAPGPIDAIRDDDAAKREAAQCLRDAFIASLSPDWILVASLFEDGPNSVVRVGGACTAADRTAVVLYDLIPHRYPDLYLADAPRRAWYTQKLDALRQAGLLLSISAATAAEAVEHLGVAPDTVVNISGAVGHQFRPLATQGEHRRDMADRYRLTRPFVMYTGGIDHRKNIDGLLRAWRLLPAGVRATYQLALVCTCTAAEADHLRATAKALGLADDDLVLTGYVSDDDLVWLYNLCTAFVFPSWHEGFGLPVLEAMACGRAVIAANRSSLPEIVGRADALFDPFDDRSMADQLERVLTNLHFRQSLSADASERAAAFSWDASARRAWAAIEAAEARHRQAAVPPAPGATPAPVSAARPRLAYLSPLPPQRSGISGHSAKLLPELARHYTIDVIVTEPVQDEWIRAHCAVRSVEWFRAHAQAYERVVYHVGNSIFHQHMFDLLGEVPGVVVLHDFHLAGITALRDLEGHAPHAWTRALYDDQGYTAVAARLSPQAPEAQKWTYPCSRGVIRDALGVVVHSANARRRVAHWYGDHAARQLQVVPLLREPAPPAQRQAARARLKLTDDDVLVCSFGLLGEAKLNHRLVQAWRDSRLSDDPRCRLVFVGQDTGGAYGAKLMSSIRKPGDAVAIRVTGWVDAQQYQDYLWAADVAVQLRVATRGDTSAAVLDAMNNGIATITNADDFAAPAAGDVVLTLSEEFSDAELAQALKALRADVQRRSELGRRARELIHSQHRPAQCAAQYVEAIEHFYRQQRQGLVAAIDALAHQNPRPGAVHSIALASALAQNHAAPAASKQLLVDVSELVQRDVHSGIQRVTRAVLKRLLANPPAGYRVEPVYARLDATGYFHARVFTSGFLGLDAQWAVDEPVAVQAGDVFIGLDLQHRIVPMQADTLAHWRLLGVRTYFVVYDLLPSLRPELFVPGARALMQGWIHTVADADGAICISRATARELMAWMDVFGQARQRPFHIGWFHLGADVENSVPTGGMPASATRVLQAMADRPSFLMVGTIEARKGHGQALSAFEQLWAQGLDVNLVVVGNPGWMVDRLIERMRVHPERGQRFFWIEGASDEYLDRLYGAATVLLAPSEAEGFGLPLIEAARKGLPLLARNLAVFREVAGAHAYYFEDDNRPQTLATAVMEWLGLFQRQQHPGSSGIPWSTWETSVQQLLRGPLHNAWYQAWVADGIHRYWGSDPRLGTHVGRARGTAIETTGRAGFLIFGPYRALPAGRYRLLVEGLATRVDPQACWLDITARAGTRTLKHTALQATGPLWRQAIEFALDEAVSDLEFRVFVDASAQLRIDAIRIEPCTASRPDTRRTFRSLSAATP